LFIELWNKGVLWDKLLGVHFLDLKMVRYAQTTGPGKWLQIDEEYQTRNSEVVGTAHPTGHSLLADFYLELPFGTFFCCFNFKGIYFFYCVLLGPIPIKCRVPGFLQEPKF
jgi:protein unc-13